jgi:hypothetical protein
MVYLILASMSFHVGSIVFYGLYKIIENCRVNEVEKV